MKPVLLFLLLGSACVFAQEQERKLMDRIKKPDMTLDNPMQSKAFNAGGKLELRKAGESKDSFYGVRDASIKEGSFTRSFLGIKNPWFGNKVYDTKTASTWSKSLIKNADLVVPVKKAEAVGYWDATKQANFGSPVVPVQAFIPQGKAQGAVSGISDKVNNKMTIDEVRELLNKPR